MYLSLSLSIYIYIHIFIYIYIYIYIYIVYRVQLCYVYTHVYIRTCIMIIGLPQRAPHPGEHGGGPGAPLPGAGCGRAARLPGLRVARFV